MSDRKLLVVPALLSPSANLLPSRLLLRKKRAIHGSTSGVCSFQGAELFWSALPLFLLILLLATFVQGPFLAGDWFREDQCPLFSSVSRVCPGGICVDPLLMKLCRQLNTKCMREIREVIDWLCHKTPLSDLLNALHDKGILAPS